VNPNFGGTADAVQNAGGAKNKTAKPAPVAAAKKPATKKPAAGIGNPFAMPGIKTDIKTVSGQHDIYFIFKNDNAKADQPLMSVSNIKFNNEKKGD